MKIRSKIAIAITVLLSITSCEAQIKNAKTATVKVYGNCGMCKKTIEKAGSLRNEAKVDWDADTKIATLTYDVQKTNSDAILKRIALSGHDSDQFLAPDDTYAKLPDCCQYDREAKTAVKKEAMADHQDHQNHTAQPKEAAEQANPLKAVFDHYFLVKDALVKTDGNTAASKAKELQAALDAVRMEQLESKVHTIWMKVVADLKADAKRIADTKDPKRQRDHFDTLSQNLYELIKESKQETPTYYQFCPMANEGKGANWLSKEAAIKNPYYGATMLSCGKTVETIQ